MASSRPSARRRSSDSNHPGRTEVESAHVRRERTPPGRASVDRLEEDPGAVLLQPLQALLVVSLGARARSVRPRHRKPASTTRACARPSFGEHLPKLRKPDPPEPDERVPCASNVTASSSRASRRPLPYAHCTTATPRNRALHATAAVCRPWSPAVTAARARKSGRSPVPKQWQRKQRPAELG